MDIKELKANAFGITRTIDRVGRIVIPSEIREKLCMKEGDDLEIFAVKGGILLVKVDNEEEEVNNG